MKLPRQTGFLAALLLMGACAAPSVPVTQPATPPPAAAPASGFTAPRPPALLYTTFQDHAVLQRDHVIPFQGVAHPGAVITVTLGQSRVSATADAAGHWQVAMAAPPAGGPYTLTAQSSDGTTQTLNDIMVGDVFLCSGQSNMEMPVMHASNYGSDISGATNKALRLFHVQRFPSPAVRGTFGADASWAVTNPQSVADFSATCYNFGKAIQPVLGVPVGLIEDAWGGSVIQAWISPEKMRRFGGYEQRLDLLAAYASDPQGAKQQWRDVALKWWQVNDPALKEKKPWFDPAFDDSAWDSILPNGTWRIWNVPKMKTFNGTVWLREKVTLTAAQAKQGATLALGAIDSSDIAWVNGTLAGAGQGYDVPRNYALAAGTLQEGSNVITVAVLGGAGLLAPAGEMTLQLADGSKIALNNPWRYRTAVPMEKLPPMPSVPWLNQFGLSVLSNGMIKPLQKTPVRAVIWYQGESNADNPAEYAKLLPTLIDDWREQFGPVPFIVVQLPNFGLQTQKPPAHSWGDMRAAQAAAVRARKDTALVTTIDIGQVDNIHPTNKQEMGRRIALVAQKLVYRQDVISEGPQAVSVLRHGKTITVHFTSEDKALVAVEAGRPLGFQLCGADGVCHYADARLQGMDVLVDAGEAKVAKLRYCWSDSPICNLFNAAGLPATPFELPVSP